MSEIYIAWAEYKGYHSWGITGSWWEYTRYPEGLFHKDDLIKECIAEMISL